MAEKKTTQEITYEARKAIAVALISKQLPIRQYEEEDGKKRQIPLAKQTVGVPGLGTLRVLLTPEGSVWEEDTPIRLIDERNEFVFWVGWERTESGPWLKNAVLKVEELQGRSLKDYRQDTLEAWEEAKQQRKKEKAMFWRKVLSN